MLSYSKNLKLTTKYFPLTLSKNLVDPKQLKTELPFNPFKEFC